MIGVSCPNKHGGALMTNPGWRSFGFRGPGQAWHFAETSVGRASVAPRDRGCELAACAATLPTSLRGPACWDCGRAELRVRGGGEGWSAEASLKHRRGEQGPTAHGQCPGLTLRARAYVWTAGWCRLRPVDGAPVVGGRGRVLSRAWGAGWGWQRAWLFEVDQPQHCAPGIHCAACLALLAACLGPWCSLPTAALAAAAALSPHHAHAHASLALPASPPLTHRLRAAALAPTPLCRGVLSWLSPLRPPPAAHTPLPRSPRGLRCSTSSLLPLPPHSARLPRPAMRT